MSYCILLVEDNPHIMEINYEAMIMEDYKVLRAMDGKSCLTALQNNDIDLIVLDIMLPDTDGLALCRKIKAEYDIPILFLSALGENEQIIEGLRAGGDDYLPKPHDIGVLLARIEARLRAAGREKRFLSHAGLRLDTVKQTAYFADRDLLLTQKEFLILLTLLQNPHRVVAREALFFAVWGVSPAGDHSALHTTVSRLNKKLNGASVPIRVGFQRGEGYTLEDI